MCFVQKSLKFVCLLLLTCLLCVKSQDPEKEAVKILTDLPEFEISIIQIPSEDKNKVADAVKGNSKLSPADLQNFDYVVGYTFADKKFTNVCFFSKDHEHKQGTISSPHGSEVVSDQVYLDETGQSVDQVCTGTMAPLVEDVEEDIGEILTSKKAKSLAVGVERTAIRVEGKLFLYTVVFFKVLSE